MLAVEPDLAEGIWGGCCSPAFAEMPSCAVSSINASHTVPPNRTWIAFRGSRRCPILKIDSSSIEPESRRAVRVIGVAPEALRRIRAVLRDLGVHHLAELAEGTCFALSY